MRRAGSKRTGRGIRRVRKIDLLYIFFGDWMDNEIYDTDCAACSRAQKDYADLEKITDDLANVVMRLSRALKKASPDNDLPEKAMDYLKRNGMAGTVLRDV